mgnify:CR=1 FL=1
MNRHFYNESQIPPSELIINEEGRIYHLDLHPSEIANDIIIVGDQERVPEVSKYFDKIEIQWDSNTQTSKYNKTQSYSILRSKTNNFRNYSGYKTIASEVTETSYTDTDEELLSGETYFYRVISHNLVTDNYTTTEYKNEIVSSPSFTGYTGSFSRGQSI